MTRGPRVKSTAGDPELMQLSSSAIAEMSAALCSAVLCSYLIP